MDHLEALKSEAIDGLDRNDLRIGVHQQSLDLDPLLLLLCEVMGSLSLLDFFIELVDDNGNEEIHDEEGSQEDEHDKDE